MCFKFSLCCYDEDGNEIGFVGKFRSIKGFTGEDRTKIEGKDFHVLELMNFQFDDDFKKLVAENKIAIDGFDICIINKEGLPIGKYYFALREVIHYYTDGFPENGSDLKMVGILHDFPCEEGLECWKLWRISPPETKNEWIILSEDGRRGWLEVVRRYRFCVGSVPERRTNETFYLDGTYITDYSSFFIAVGEAINGPGGYYGSSLDGFEDCLCCRREFGTFGDFTMVWGNYQVAKEHLDLKAWQREVTHRQKMENRALDGREYSKDITGPSLLSVIEEIIEERGITIIRK